MTDMKALKALTRSAHTANVAVDKKAKEARVLSARAVFAVTESGVIGTDEGKAAGWGTQGDYAAALGVSAGTITGLKRLGWMLDKGMTPDHEQWSLLSSKAGTKEVGDAIAAEGATVDSVLKALTDTFKPDGRRVTQTQDGRSGEGAEGAPERPKKVETPEDVLVAIHAIQETAHGFDVKGKAKVLKGLERAVLDMRNRIKADEAAAAKAASEAKAS
jgi:hypothetical protein